MVDAARQIVRTLREAGYAAFYAGGAVRDRLLGRDPGDYDVATSARPDAIMRLFPKHTAVGAHFGVVLVHLDGHSIEVATFRTEGSYRDGRHPSEVVYADTPQEDVQRRDFTINGLLADPETDAVIDYVGGRRDLEARLIRAIGDPERRFREDHLRMLRAVRFAARLDFQLEAATAAAIRHCAARIRAISAERVRDEILRMLTEGHARRAFELLDETGLLEPVLPEIAAMKGVAQPPQFHPEGDVWVHTLMMLERLPAGCSPTLALGVLLHDVGKPPTFSVAPDRIRFNNHAAIGARMSEAICQRLRLSSVEQRQVTQLVEHHMRFMDAPRMRESTLRRFLRLDGFDEHLELHRLDCLSSHGNLKLYNFVRQRREELPPEALRPPRLVNGHELMELGYAPGPAMGRMLEALEEEQLEGRLATHEDALAFLRSRFPAPGRKSRV